MTYAEAVKHMEYVLYQAGRATLGPESKQTGDEALADLRRAVPLIEAAMGYKPEPFGHGRERLHEAAQDYQQKTSEKGEKP